MLRHCRKNLEFLVAALLLGACASGVCAPTEQASAGFGDTISLKAQGAAFESLFLESPRKDAHGGAVLVRGRDARSVFTSLYKGLPERGWRTVYLLAPSDADADQGAISLNDAVARIEAAIAWLKERKTSRIVLAGQDLGTFAVARYLAKMPDKAVTAAVFVDAPEDGDASFLEDVGKIGVPLLDILGERGKTLDTAAARARKTAARNGRGYRQTVLADSSMTLLELQEWLLNRIHGWLRRLPPNVD